MKRWIHAAKQTQVRKFKNRRNPNKRLEVHEDGYGHRSAKQYMEWEDVGVKNPVGDGNLHRWRKGNMDELLDDYEEIESSSSDFADPYIDDSKGYFRKDSPDDTPNHIYVVSLWYEVDPGHDMIGPQAAQRIFDVAADTEDEAIRAVESEWQDFGLGPADRIEILEVDPEDTEEDIPFEASTEVEASTNITASELVDNGQIQVGLVYHRDGFTAEIIDVSDDHKTCTERETWINEDTGEDMEKITKCKIAQDENGNEFYYDPKYEEYAFKSGDPDGYSWWARKYATGADNYPHDTSWFEDESPADPFEEDDEYTPSATAGDYSPSNPWDAPGMSKSDFI